jgi:two-component system, chemotaxis family, CheB/CheR fusion protein
MDATTAQFASPEPSADRPAFSVVGIGASAGGLEAFTQLFEHLPATTGMAYVVIQHLDPHRPSLLPGLLARATTMPVHEGEDDMAVLPDHVYVIPPNADLTLEHASFRLLPRSESRMPHLAIDTFFRSLAKECQQRAIGVLLSGTAFDGTEGQHAIKAAGGITFAQDAHSARFSQMPQHAIAAGCVDHVLPPEEIARALASLALHAPLVLVPLAEPGDVLPESEEEQVLTTILLTLRHWTGVDFLAYKPTTLKRRISHRVAALHLERLVDYAQYLQSHQGEVDTLYREMLIHVTSFFRDAPALDALSRIAFPAIVAQHDSGEAIRIWVPGCSTGEEAYSLAICLLEFLEEHRLSLPILLFATDINPQVLNSARMGIYPAQTLVAISPERLARFFTPVDRARGSYRIIKEVRERCLFAPHNVVKDPPFSHLDLLSCRNVLIYLGQPLQQKAIQTFHYALAPHGFLLLGTAESADPHARLFACVEPRQKLYVKKAAGSSLLPNLIASRQTAATSAPLREGDIPMPEESNHSFDLQQEADRLLLALYAPAYVIVDANLKILYVRGSTGPYLELATGKASFDLLNMARVGLVSGLRTALHTARKENHAVKKESLLMSEAGTTREVRITVTPMKAPADERYFLVLFEEMPSSPPRSSASPHEEQASGSRKRGAAARRIAALEQELAIMAANMQAMVEERDAANQKLQAVNEEILAGNEELQSINEELQTINEELSTSNQELETRNEQLKESQEYAEAIVETVREPLIVLDADLHIQRANTAFYLSFGGVPPEVEGRYLYELGNGQWNIPSLRTLLDQVLETNQSFQDFEVEHDFPSIGHKIMLLNARRLLHTGKQGRNQLILLALEDITVRKELERRNEALLGSTSQERTSASTHAERTGKSPPTVP